MKYGKELEEYYKSKRKKDFIILDISLKAKAKELRKPKRQQNVQLIQSLSRIDSSLYQCQFCYGYRVGRAENSVAWHCESGECAKAYKEWLKEINNEDIHLKDLRREEGF